MNRYRIVIAACMLLVSAAPGEGGTVSIVNSKHNLSSSGSGSIKSLAPGSGGTSEICVFCHTPHTARLEAPLWNRTNPAGPYTVYYSDVMSALSITPESPVQAGGGYAVHVKTRICMSCHDGTIALGQLVNMPAGMSGSVAMQGTTGGNMPSSASGYIGTDLRDDHPVAVKHMDPAAVNPEMKSLSGSQVRLYYDAGGGVIRSNQNNGGWIECTSCHDAHDNQYGNFLIDDNVGSKICLSCHDKAGYTSTNANESVHSNDAQYNNLYQTATGGIPATLGTTVQNVKCMVCHYPHKSGVNSAAPATPSPATGKYLLAYQEEQTCYNPTNRWSQANASCHDTGGAGKNIKTVITLGSAHRVGSNAGLHNATEGKSVSASGTGWLGVTGNSWHVECDDCHNSHAAGRLIHTAGTNTVVTTNTIYGAGGAEPPAAYGAWSVPAANSYTYIEPIGLLRISGVNLGVTKEYQICIKCHSSFAWGTSGPGALQPAGMTDQAKEFNTANASFHPVMGPSANTQGTYLAPWTNGNQTMYCSDCHGNDGASPQGPHGSGITKILRYTALASFNTTTNGTQDEGAISSSLCLQCHAPTVYNTFATGDSTAGTGFRDTAAINLHNRHKTLARTAGSSYAYRCVNCHVKVPHGWNARKAMIIAIGDPETGTYAPAGGPLILTANLVNPGLYSTGDASKNVNCTTAAGCH